MFKLQNFKQYIPSSVVSIISPNAPKPDQNNEHCINWLTNYPTGKLRNAIYFKGPLFFTKYMPEIAAEFAAVNTNINIPVQLFKKHTKAFIQNLQTEGHLNEWEGKNSMLYYVPGLPRTYRTNTLHVSYTYE